MESKMIGAHSEVIRMVKDIEGKLEDIKVLEQNINIMHKMFVDLAALVYSQGELLNSIEKQVSNSAAYIKKANVQLEKAKEHRKVEEVLFAVHCDSHRFSHCNLKLRTFPSISANKDAKVCVFQSSA